ncbi:MAG: DUF309 domain-containing protein [Chloroflexi bacterium]|nr:DUF309 domain-containing protein [Chloroflexota bacterium]
MEQFNRQEFYECHETLEAIWLAEPGRIRELYQGILQIGVAFYHLGRANFRGAASLLETGIDHLRPFEPRCMGVNTGGLVEAAWRARTRLEELGPHRLSEFEAVLIPQITLATAS